MLVKEAMTRKVKTIRPDETVRKAAKKMNKNRIGSLVVVDGKGEVVGIITERDIMIDVVAQNLNSDNIKVEEIMTGKDDLILITPDASLEDAVEAMTKYSIKKLPVVEDGDLVGIITATDLLKYEKVLIESLSKLLTFPKKETKSGA